MGDRLGYLKDAFARRNFHPSRNLGQNFLIDPNLADFIVREAGLSPEELVLEVGGGTGLLTQRLSQGAAKVVSVELDSRLAGIARGALAGRENVEVLVADVLESKTRINPLVVERVRAGLKPGAKAAVVSNLPYGIASPLIMDLLAGHYLLVRPDEDAATFPIDRMILMVQWEVAERLVSRPGRRSFGVISVLAQALADLELVRRVPPQVFWPRPKVDSALIRIRPKDPASLPAFRLPVLRRLAQAVFQQRRKTVLNALAGNPFLRLDRDRAESVLKSVNIDPKKRSETLDSRKMIQLSVKIESLEESRLGLVAPGREGYTSPVIDRT